VVLLSLILLQNKLEAEVPAGGRPSQQSTHVDGVVLDHFLDAVEVIECSVPVLHEDLRSQLSPQRRQVVLVCRGQLKAHQSMTNLGI
jgi:hypothetical protein